MSRSDVRSRVVLMPMEIRTQVDNGKVVACLPGWNLPPNNFVEGDTEDAAINALRDNMWRRWALIQISSPTLPITRRRRRSGAWAG